MYLIYYARLDSLYLSLSFYFLQLKNLSLVLLIDCCSNLCILFNYSNAKCCQLFAIEFITRTKFKMNNQKKQKPNFCFCFLKSLMFKMKNLGTIHVGCCHSEIKKTEQNKNKIINTTINIFKK